MYHSHFATVNPTPRRLEKAPFPLRKRLRKLLASVYDGFAVLGCPAGRHARPPGPFSSASVEGDKHLTTRRTFLQQAAASAVSSTLLVSHLASHAQSALPGPGLTLTIDGARRLATMPLDFVGLSYESAQLGHTEFFSAGNAQLINLVRALGRPGVLRIGGNTQEYTTWSANDADAAKNLTPESLGPDAGTAAKTASILTPKSIRNLRDFLDAIGWHVIYGLNLWHGTEENAVAEAMYVSQVLGSRLIAFQIGNEPDMNHDPGSKERWTFDNYWEKWSRYRAAVQAAVPTAKFAGPDIAKEYDWVTKTAAKHPDITFLSGHYYAEGPPRDPKMTIEYLLHRGRDPGTEEIGIVTKATQALGRPFRMTEGNSCFHGGKPGVSDTFASALWAGDYMLQVAQAGYLGVNLHGGGEGLYTPIAGSPSGGFKTRPVFYGMLLAQRFAGRTFVQASLSQQDSAQNVTAFAAIDRGGRYSVALFNKAGAPVSVHIVGLTDSRRPSMLTLHAPAIDSQEGVTFGGQSLTPDGEFHARNEQGPPVTRRSLICNMKPYTAVLMEG